MGVKEVKEMGRVIRIEMVMPSVEGARAHFPEAKKQFSSGTSGLALKAARISPRILLEKNVVVVELGFSSEQYAKLLLPMFEKQMLTAVEKEKDKMGSCISTRVFLKEEATE